jgi:hypothetical protein
VYVYVVMLVDQVVWVGSPPIFPFKPRDFCTVVHVRKLKDGTVVILNRATKHRLAPETNEYQRAAILLAANIIQPVKGAPVRVLHQLHVVFSLYPPSLPPSSPTAYLGPRTSPS